MIVSSINTFDNSTQFSGLKTHSIKKVLPIVAAGALLANIGLTSCSTKDNFQKQIAQEQYEAKYPVMSKILNKDGSPTWKTVGLAALALFIWAGLRNDSNNKKA